MLSVIENSVNLDAVNLDTLYLVKLIFGKYFCYFDSNSSLFYCNCNCTWTQIAFRCTKVLMIYQEKGQKDHELHNLLSCHNRANGKDVHMHVGRAWERGRSWYLKMGTQPHRSPKINMFSNKINIFMDFNP